ncbi:hypothetical protein VIGAN_03237100 [Vigna angularis var. angularis]|uniref:Uncharacterized protein n=1 Tax=Vigna angularis var. angularis TaxID=157739 RepID=A0A0S3RP62_PHAAN|nr:hypothetical protein VIGAN_03237100 [Vigna angularis var. angularis]
MKQLILMSTVTTLSFFYHHLKDEHLTPLFEEIVKLERALFNIQCEQHWLEAHPERQAIEYSSQLGAPDKVLFYLWSAAVLFLYLSQICIKHKA